MVLPEVIHRGLIPRIRFWRPLILHGTTAEDWFLFQGSLVFFMGFQVAIPYNTKWFFISHRSAQKGFAVGFWPLPEAFWPDVNAPSLPQRSAHPNVKFTCTDYEPMIIENLPFDKYELEPSPLTQYLLARKQPKVCWQVGNFKFHFQTFFYLQLSMSFLFL